MVIIKSLNSGGGKENSYFKRRKGMRNEMRHLCDYVKSIENHGEKVEKIVGFQGGHIMCIKNKNYGILIRKEYVPKIVEGLKYQGMIGK